MSDLAFTLSGEPFEVPNTAGGWRVRRLKPKGAPDVVYGLEGIPLVLPIDADMADLRREARTEGRYRLDLVDDHNRVIPNTSAAYVCIHASEPPAEPSPTARPVPPSTDHAVIEAMRLNSELARSIVDKFPLMLESAAALVRAADGAGMPAREPRALPEPRERQEDEDEEAEDEEDEDEGEVEMEDPASKAKASSWAGLLETLIPFVAPALMNALTSGKLQLPGGLGALFDCRRASPKASAAGARTANPPAAVPAPDQRVPAPARRSTSSVRVVPRDATPITGEVTSARASGSRDVARAAGGRTPVRTTGPRVVLQAAAGPRDVTQDVSGAAPIRAVGSRDAMQAAGEVAAMRAIDPHNTMQAAGEVAAVRAAGSRGVTHSPAETAATHAADPRDAMQAISDGAAMRAAGLQLAAQAVNAAAPARAFAPHVAAQAMDAAAPARAFAPHVAAQAVDAAAPARAFAPHVAAQAVDAAAPARAFAPHVAAPVANELAKHEEDPELEFESELESELESESESESEPAPELSTEATTDLPTLDPAAIAHFVAIQGALTFREGMLARALAAELSPSEMRAWLTELRTLSVPDAVAKIREVIGADDSGNTGGVS